MRTGTGAQAVGTDGATRGWWQEAACIEAARTVDFFPARGESSAAAKTVCARCAVRTECLDYALQWDPLCGVWGGLSERERRQLKRRPRVDLDG
jgi:WhiB family transcriptional regulator, redox-sensing transcriptional regulator